jgi:effector-binding domain-containing protein
MQYLGPYSKTMPARNDIETYILENKLDVKGESWESDVTDPAKEPDSTKWITEI